MQFHLPQFIRKYKFIEDLHGCDLCSGVWVFGLLSFLLKFDLLTVLGLPYVPVLSELVTGGAVSFVVHLLRLGWNARFSSIEVV